MKKYFLILFLTAGFSLSGTEEKYHYISKGVVDIHAEPNEMSEVVNQAIYATPISLGDERNLWVKIQTPDSYEGWVYKSDVISRSQEYLSTPHTAQVDSLWAHLFRVDDTTPYPPVLTLPFDAKVEVASPPDQSRQRWIQVKLLDGNTVWTQRGDYRIDPSPLTLQEVVALSTRFIGIPYRWGGNSSFGFDCSGFMQTLYRQAGLQLPRDSRPQASGGTMIEENELRPGDLLFFGRIPTRITHVGMYLGEGLFIHSVTTNKDGHHTIQVSKLREQEWYEKYITARRYIP